MPCHCLVDDLFSAAHSNSVLITVLSSFPMSCNCWLEQTFSSLAELAAPAALVRSYLQFMALLEQPKPETAQP